MTWFLRFALGLPARPKDVAELREQAPELLAPTGTEHRNRSMRPLFPVLVLAGTEILYDLQEFAEAVRAWATDVRSGVGEEAGSRRAEVEPCSHPECPRKMGGQPQAQPASPPSPKPFVAELMVVGGGPDQKPLVDRFMDLIQRVHANAGEARKVIVTDPYLLTDASENGAPGGFSNFCRYLGTLRLATDAILFIPPGPKKPTANRTRWIESIKKKFPNLEVKTFKPHLSFHDRFYIVEHAGGLVRGTFGPSMNGLSDTDIALFGELEVPDTLATLSKWFDLSPPPSPRKKSKRTRPRR